MRTVQPLNRTFRHQLRLDSIIFPARNWMLRRITYLNNRLKCLLDCIGDTVETVAAVSAVLTLIRVPEPLAMETYIWNEGANVVSIFEEGVIVARVQPGARVKLAMAAYFKLHAQTDADVTQVRVTTIRRCLCGDDYSPYESGVVMPGEGDLI